MKYLIVVCVVFLFCFCCRTNNRSVESDFNKCLLIVEDYYHYTGEINDTILGRFYFANEYLEKVSNIKSRYICADIPFYFSKNDYLKNINEWNKWYKKNYHQITDDKSDSIKNLIVNKKVWWKDSTILNIVFTNDY